jgi:hypothetical protein
MTENNQVSLSLQGRAQSVGVTSMDNNLFPFDAFNFDDPNTTDSPVLRMTDPWTLAVPDIILDDVGRLSFYLERLMKQVDREKEDNSWQMSQIKVGQTEIDIRVTAQSDLQDKMSQAYINLSVDQDDSEVRIGADRVSLDGSIDLDSTLFVNNGEVQILGNLAVGTSTDNDNFKVESDGSITANNGTFNGQLEGVSGTFDTLTTIASVGLSGTFIDNQEVRLSALGGNAGLTWTDNHNDDGYGDLGDLHIYSDEGRVICDSRFDHRYGSVGPHVPTFVNFTVAATSGEMWTHADSILIRCGSPTVIGIVEDSNGTWNHGRFERSGSSIFFYSFGSAPPSWNFIEGSATATTARRMWL